MKSSEALKVLLLCAGMLIARAEAVIEGRVFPVLRKGSLTIEKASAAVAPAHSAQVPAAVVYLTGTAPVRAEKTARLVETNRAFVPAVLPVQVGTRVEFVNEDDVPHRVFSYSAAKRFELGLCAPHETEPPAQLFDVPGLVAVRCDEHDQMRGFILVLDTPHFVMTDSEGKFRLGRLPTGRFTLKAWLNKNVTLERRVELNDNSQISIAFQTPENDGEKGHD